MHCTSLPSHSRNARPARDNLIQGKHKQLWGHRWHHHYCSPLSPQDCYSEKCCCDDGCAGWSPFCASNALLRLSICTCTRMCCSEGCCKPGCLGTCLKCCAMGAKQRMGQQDQLLADLANDTVIAEPTGAHAHAHVHRL